MSAWSSGWNNNWNNSWPNSDWEGDQYTSTVDPADIRAEFDDLRDWLVVMQDECEDSKRRLNEYEDENKILAARVYELEQGKKRQQQQRIMSPVRGAVSSRRGDRPRSGSLPPPTTCFWHEAGNIASTSFPEHGMHCVQATDEAYDWWNHFSCVMLSAHAAFYNDLWNWLQHQFARHRIIVMYYYSGRVRHSVIKCNQCGDMFIMCYSKIDSTAVENKIVENHSVFSQRHGSVNEVGDCPRRQNDVLMALTN